jgi:hypothetical protein
MPRQSNSKPVPIKKPISILPTTVITKNNTLFQSVKDGFGFGLGSTIARNLFSTTSSQVTTSNNLSVMQPSCIEYKKCLESDDKYECFGNLDKKEYTNCRLETNH